ncbi:uncharacterized protein ACA1_170820 [Acanthamoeba castellanii str. Neff]|uniref:Uncharacterized protein n=1 Tax=Acanthamoeba castellanii (strain ATCC 30010 / Neff) TaxID=1257118 RepID=L8HJH2_ACACF|nr:uncharacterized protein ACA1_170820 [Acanthamoeba castellanii str. Neff]ELR24541.1 hypothetical protein ACA1_170820 [Acanthamoeba castellanii str. Neff]
MKRVIKRLVWDMCYDSQQHLSEGAQSVLVKSGPWQYSYRLWVEDVDGFELIFPPEVPFGTPHVPQTNKFYQKLMHRFFPTRGNLRCYELFTLYLSTLSVETVAHHDRELVSVLLNRTMK